MTARGVDGMAIFRSDRDRHIFLARLERVAERLDWRLLAYCLMTNHYHLLLTTPAGDLSAGMQRLNGPYAQGFNQRHGRRGTLWQERFHSERVLRESHLLATAGYIALNPVRAGLCDRPELWRWSSHPATVGLARAARPRTHLLELFDADPERARRRYAELVRGAAQSIRR